MSQEKNATSCLFTHSTPLRSIYMYLGFCRSFIIFHSLKLLTVLVLQFFSSALFPVFSPYQCGKFSSLAVQAESHFSVCLFWPLVWKKMLQLFGRMPKWKKEKCQVLSFKIRPAKVYEMIHHFLASVIITAVTNLYLLAPFKNVLNVTVKFRKLLFQLNQLKKIGASQVCALNRKLCWSPELSELPSFGLACKKHVTSV